MLLSSRCLRTPRPAPDFEAADERLAAARMTKEWANLQLQDITQQRHKDA